jgi:hypothetical protein
MPENRFGSGAPARRTRTSHAHAARHTRLPWKRICHRKPMSDGGEIVSARTLTPPRRVGMRFSDTRQVDCTGTDVQPRHGSQGTNSPCGSASPISRSAASSAVLDGIPLPDALPRQRRFIC